jgi:hypothetical protein
MAPSELGDGLARAGADLQQTPKGSHPKVGLRVSCRSPLCGTVTSTGTVDPPVIKMQH